MFLFILNKLTIEAPSIHAFNMYLRTLFQYEDFREGIPFCKNQGFHKLSPCYVTNWEFPRQNVCYNC